jgi:radical SAM protein with 4Fe4S-binding SPASM domain
LLNPETRDLETKFTLEVLEILEKYNVRANISVTIGDFNKQSFADTIENINKLKLPFNRIPFVPRSCKVHDLMFDKDSLKNYFHPVLRKYFNGQVSYTPYMLPPEIYETVSGQDLQVEQIPTNPNIGCWVGAYYAINPEGDVSPCPMFLDHVSGGNVFKTPLKSILYETELFKKITDRNNLEGKCGNCIYTHTCSGCRVMSYYLTGNVYAEDPTCFLQELNETEILEIEKETTESFKNYVRMAKFGNLFTNPKTEK